MPARVRELADGRAYTGRQALQLGLVDAIGGEHEARDWLAEDEGRIGRSAGRGRLHRRAAPAGRLSSSLGWMFDSFGKACFPKELSLTAHGRSGNVPATELSVRRPGHMTKSELIAELAASNPHLRGADVELIVATIFDEITGALARGERVELRGFGAFTVKRRNARTGRNPRTGEAVPVDEKAVPFFKAGKELRERVNRGRRAGSAGERLSLTPQATPCAC